MVLGDARGYGNWRKGSRGSRCAHLSPGVSSEGAQRHRRRSSAAAMAWCRGRGSRGRAPGSWDPREASWSSCDESKEVRVVGNPPAARNCLEVGSPAAEVQVEIRALQRLCARMECPSDCLALRQNCYNTWPGLGGCGAARARRCRAWQGGAGRAAC